MKIKNKLFLMLFFGILFVSCNNLTEEAEKKINELNSKTQSLDSLINKEVNKVLTLDTLIIKEGEKVKKLDSLINNSKTKIDSMAQQKLKLFDKITK